MERSVGQRLGGAFIVGGSIAVLAQAIMFVVGLIIPVPDLTAPVSLIFLGLFGMALVLNGSYKRLVEVGGFGAGIMFCGLVDAVAGIFLGAAMKAGGKASEGTKAAVGFALGSSSPTPPVSSSRWTPWRHRPRTRECSSSCTPS